MLEPITILSVDTCHPDYKLSHELQAYDAHAVRLLRSLRLYRSECG